MTVKVILPDGTAKTHRNANAGWTTRYRIDGGVLIVGWVNGHGEWDDEEGPICAYGVGGWHGVSGAGELPSGPGIVYHEWNC